MTTRSASEEPNGSNSEGQESPTKLDSRNLEKALRFLENLDSTTNTRGNIKLHLSVDEIVKHSMRQGLEPSHITTLVDIIVSANHKLSQTIRSKFVKCLVPSSKVPQAAIVRVLSHISSKIFNSPGPSNLHSLLLRWILLVFDYIDGYDQLHKLYGVVFCFINSHRLLPHACHLLFLLTTKSDVRLFRVQKLLEIIKSLGPEPYVMGLLMIYKVYCPHLVPMKLEFGYKVFFKAHDTTWRSTIEAVLKQRQDETSRNFERQQKAGEIQSRREKARIQPRSKRQKLMIPEVHSAAHEVEEDADVESHDLLQTKDKIPYTQIETFTGFLEAVDRIEYPSQIAACLSEPKLQLLLACNPDPLVMARLCFWIQHIFAFGFKGTGKDSSESNEKLLQMLFTFSKNVEGLPVVFGFLESFLPTWDGQSYAPLIFSLITCVRPCSYDELHCSILEPLQRIFFSSDVYAKTMCISALTKLMQNFALEEKSGSVSPADRTSSVSQPQGGEVGGDGGRSQQTEDSTEERVVLVLRDRNTLDTMYRLISFLDVVIVIGMRMESDHYLLQACSLDLLQLISEMYLKYNIRLVCLPMRVIHRLLLSDCAATLARLCGIINVFREAFVKLKFSSKRQLSLSLTCATTGDKPENTGTDKFNSLLLDVLGMLWQGRMFTDRKHKYESICRFRYPSHMEGKLKDNALTIYRGPAFLGLAYKFLKETQGYGKRVHPVQIQEIKETYLQFLVREGFPEFMHFVNTNIKRRQSQN